jgi:hypothetical protein
MNDLAEDLAQARQRLAAHAGAPGWAQLSNPEREAAVLEAKHYLDAAAAAGIAVAAVDPGEIPTPRRRTAMMRDTDGNPLERDEYAAWLDAEASSASNGERRPLLGDGEAGAVAALLDELSGVYRGEPLGQLARELAVRLYDRLGI